MVRFQLPWLFLVFWGGVVAPASRGLSFSYDADSSLVSRGVRIMRTEPDSPYSYVDREQTFGEAFLAADARAQSSLRGGLLLGRFSVASYARDQATRAESEASALEESDTPDESRRDAISRFLLGYESPSFSGLQGVGLVFARRDLAQDSELGADLTREFGGSGGAEFRVPVGIAMATFGVGLQSRVAPERGERSSIPYGWYATAMVEHIPHGLVAANVNVETVSSPDPWRERTITGGELLARVARYRTALGVSLGVRAVRYNQGIPKQFGCPPSLGSTSGPRVCSRDEGVLRSSLSINWPTDRHWMLEAHWMSEAVRAPELPEYNREYDVLSLGIRAVLSPEFRFWDNRYLRLPWRSWKGLSHQVM